MQKITLKKAFRDSIPVMAGYLVLGMGFGILLHSKGYDFLWAVLMSVVIYAGSAQYLAVDLLSGGVSLVTAAVMTLMINARHFFYGISMLDKYRNLSRKIKSYVIFALTDETYALVCTDRFSGKEIELSKYYFYVSFFNQCYWIIGSAVGGLLGAMVHFNSKGIEFSMTALFVVIFIEQWLGTKKHIPAVLGISISLICLLIFGQEIFVIPSMIGIAAALLGFRNRLEVTRE